MHSVKTKGTFNNTSYVENIKRQCKWSPLIRKQLIPPLGQKEKRWPKCQGSSPKNNINENVDIFKVGDSDMPFWVNLQMKGVAQLGPKSGPPWGGPHSGLRYKFKCWARSDSQFDNIHELHKCQQNERLKRGAIRMFSMH